MGTGFAPCPKFVGFVMIFRTALVILVGAVGYIAWVGYAQQDTPGKIEEITGMITGTDQKGDEFSVRLRSLSKTYTVQIGSMEFLEKQNLKLDTGQLITVKGTVSGDTIVAHEIKKGDQIVVLRNEKGEPMWVGKVPVPVAPVDPNRVRLAGKITKIERSADHLIATIQTDANETLRIDLGSETFLKERSIHLAEGGSLEVQALRSTSDGAPFFIATEIHYENQLVALPGRHDDLFHAIPLGPWAVDSEYNRQFKADQPAKVDGSIQDIVKFSLAPDATEGVALIVSTSQGPVTCHLGPMWFIVHQGMVFKKGDPISCTGSMATFQGQNVLLVGQLSRGNESLMIRDPQGMPCFAAYRKAGQ